jgi:hypothetical protein
MKRKGGSATSLHGKSGADFNELKLTPKFTELRAHQTRDGKTRVKTEIDLFTGEVKRELI